MGDPQFKTVDSQAEKAQIFEKVKEIRDKFYKFNPNLKICISDQQIKKNIDLKYDYYKKCKNYYDFRKENDKYKKLGNDFIIPEKNVHQHHCCCSFDGLFL